MTIKLTDAQLVMMSAAALREDRCLATPEKLKGTAVAKLGAKLVGAGLAREIKAKPDMPIWRRDDEERPFALKLTAAGLKAIAVGEDAGAGATGAQVEVAPTEKVVPAATAKAFPAGDASAPRASSKLALVIGLLQREGGATIGDLTEVTGWLPHTTRAAITGVRKRGYSVTRDKGDGDGASAYRILGAAGAAHPETDKGAGASSSRRSRSNAKKAA